MMIMCSLCGKQLQDKDRVTGIVTAWYKELPSKVAYAIYDQGMFIAKDTLAHYDCEDPNNADS